MTDPARRLAATGTVQADSRPYFIDRDWSVPLVARLFKEIRGVAASSERFQWLYLDNPAGVAEVWILREEDGDVAGFTACLPRSIWVAGQRRRALVGSDFSMFPRHRTMGPALALRRQARPLVDERLFDLLLSHPVPAMLAVHARVGHPRLGHLSRWVLPLRVESFLRHLPGARRKIMSGLGDGVLALRRAWSAALGAGVSVQPVDSFSSEYDELDAALGRSHQVVGTRNAAYLTWRFLDRPDARRPTVLEARSRDGRLGGYLLLEMADGMAEVKDFAALPDSRALPALLHAASTLARSERADRMQVTLLANSGRARTTLRRLGFIERPEPDQMPVVCYGGIGFQHKRLVESADAWFMTMGDRDV